MAIERFIETIYEAPFAAAGWRDLTMRLEHEIGAPVAIFRRTADAVETLGACMNADADRVIAYEQRLWREDRGLDRLWRAPAGAVVRDSALIEDRERRGSAFYDGYLGAMGLARGIYASAAAAGHEQLVIGAHRAAAAGDWRPAEMELFRSLLPHLARAFRSWATLQAAHRVRDASLDALASANLAMLLVDDDGRLRFANRLADALLAAGPLVLTGGRVTADDRLTAQQLRRAIREAVACGTGGAVTLIGSGGDERLVSVAPSRGDGSERLAMLVLGGERERPEPQRLGRAFKLTAAEAQLLSALVVGERLKDYAARTGISLNTARTHLAALFDKTGERRQSDLIRRALRDPLLFSADD